MKQLFEFDIHIGDWRVLVQSRDIQNGAVQSRHISEGAIESRHIADKAVQAQHIDGTIEARHIADKAIESRHIEDNSIKGDHFDDDGLHHGKIADDAIWARNIKDRNVTSRKIEKKAIQNEHLSEKSVGPSNVTDDFQGKIVLPITNQLDGKYENITQELYSMIASLQVGGIALSGKFGNRTDIGIHQKALTEALGRLWEELGTLTGKTYIDYTLTVQPTFIPKEGAATVTATADSSEAISNFDSIKLYVNGVLKAESHDVTRYIQNLTIESEGVSTIKAEGIIFGKTIIKEAQVSKLMPFFMGSGQDYQEVMVPECQKDLEGTLEGDYDVTIRNNGDYMFIIIPASHKDEFRRADMNGLGLKVEIPLSEEEHEDFVVYKSLNTYKAGTYKIDIDINS